MHKLVKGINVYKSEDRGLTKNDWLLSYHTFSFGHYLDPAKKGFKTLKVINEDFIKPGSGFDSHSHQNMEILTYVLAGTLSHKDSLGHEQDLQAGDFQLISAGAGLEHSEFNNNKKNPVQMFQLWIQNKNKHSAPRYQKLNSPALEKNKFNLLASFADNGLFKIDQDLELFFISLEPGHSLTLESKVKSFFVQQLKSSLIVAGAELRPSDGMSVEDFDAEVQFTNSSKELAEFLLLSF